MKHLIKKFKQITILLLVLSFAGCDDDEVMLPKIIPGFTYTVNTDTGAVTFINTSVNARNYFWTFGDGTSSTLTNPTNTYATGTYEVTLKATNVAGASETYSAEINVIVKEAMSLPVTFDNIAVKYEASVFNGVTFEIVENPDVSGTNNKASNVGAITNSGAAYEGLYFDLAAPIDLTADKKVTMNVWADAAVDVLVKLEEGTAAPIEGVASHGGTGWEMISVEYGSSDQYSRLTMFVDGPGSTAGTFYIDDIAQAKGNPVITLNGDANMSVEIGGTFTDPGATAVDAYGTDISSSIVVGGDAVDTNTVGTYTITYNVSDNEGNAAEEVTRTVNVAADAVAPVITLVGDATMTLTVGDSFTDPGATASDNLDGDITANIVVGGDTVDTNTAGSYTITYNVSDAAGNAAAEVTRTVNVQNPAGAGAYIYASTAAVTIPSVLDNWGSGTTIDDSYTGDGTYSPVIHLTSGVNWGDVSAVAFTQMETGILANYETLEFKIKTTDYSTVRVKVPENEIGFNIADGTPLADGWVQMSLPLSNWSGEVAAANQFAILEFGAGQMLITDVMLSGEGNGGGGNTGGGGGGNTGGGTGGGCTGDAVDATAFPVTFESCESFLGTFTGSGSITTSLDDNPAKGGINTSDYVLKVVKSAGSNRWAGIQNKFPSFFDATKTFKVLVYTNKANVVMRFEVNSDPQDPQSGNPGPVFRTITEANTWTEVEFTFDVPGNNTGLNQLVIKPDNPEGTDGETTGEDGVYYFDNLRLE